MWRFNTLTGLLTLGILLPTVGVCQVVGGKETNDAIDLTFLDPSCHDMPVLGVRIRVERPHKSKKGKWDLIHKGRTDSSGHFAVSTLQPGEYRTVSQKYGFKIMLHHFEIAAGNAHHLTVSMERGYASDDANPGSPKYDPCKHQDLKPKWFVHVP